MEDQQNQNQQQRGSSHQRRPPMSSDGIYYHLPLVGQWLHSGRLYTTPDLWQYCLPGNGELWEMLFAATGIERIIEPSMLPIGLLCAAVVAGIGRALGATVRAATLCACMALASPMFALQSYGSYVDLFSATFLAASCYWILRLASCSGDSRQPAGMAALAGLSLGLAAGTRMMILGWVGPVTLVFLLAARRAVAGAMPAGGARRSFLSLAGVFFACSLVCSSYWYARNTLQTGWPLYPVSLRILGYEIGRGEPMTEICTDLAVRGWTSLAYSWIESKPHGYPYSTDNGLGVVFAVCALPGVVYLLIRRIRLSRRRFRFADGMTLGLIAIGAVLFVKVFFSHARYTLPLWLIVFAAAGPMWSLLVRYRARTGLLILGTATSLSVAMIALWPAKTLLGHLQEGDLSRSAWYELPRALETLPPGTVILNLSRGPMNYALFGPRWQNVVIDTITAGHYGLRAPLGRADLDARGVEVVLARETQPPGELFRPDVSYEELCEAQPISRPIRSRAYRILRPTIPGAVARAGMH